MIIHEFLPYYNTQKRLTFTMSKKYPFLKREKIGLSLAGRSIYALSLGNPVNMTLYAAGFHALEHITVTVSFMFLEALCAAAQTDGDICGIDVRKSLATRGIIIVPCVNPDGVEIVLSGPESAGKYLGNVLEISKGDFGQWNANARGVDINHNFDAKWDTLSEEEKKLGIFSPSPRRFGGYYPESEPETRALTELCGQKSIRKVMAIHSQGEEIYWDFDGKAPYGAKALGELLASKSGYTLCSPNESIASYGGFKDWFIDKKNGYGFTVEIGKGKNPLPPETAHEIYKRIEEMLVLFAIT